MGLEDEVRARRAENAALARESDDESRRIKQARSDYVQEFIRVARKHAIPTETLRFLEWRPKRFGGGLKPVVVGQTEAWGLFEYRSEGGEHSKPPGLWITVDGDFLEDTSTQHFRIEFGKYVVVEGGRPRPAGIYNIAHEEILRTSVVYFLMAAGVGAE